MSRLSGVMGFAREQAGRPPRSLRARLEARVKDPERVGAARRPPGRGGSWRRTWSRQFPPTQVILLDEKREYEIRRDERMKLLALPLWQIDSRPAPSASDGDGLFADLLPDVVKLRRSAGAAGAAGRPAAARRGAAAVRRGARRQAARRSCPTSACRCRSTRSPASRSTTTSRGRPPTSAAAAHAEVRPERRYRRPRACPSRR